MTRMQKLACELLEDSRTIILDTETTGFGSSDEVIQIGIIDPVGKELMNTLLRPGLAIVMPGAFQVHGISNEQLTDAPTWDDIRLDLQGHLRVARSIVAYNANFDKRLLLQSAEANKDEDLYAEIMAAEWVDIMQPYADFWGAWNPRRSSNTWQTLKGACAQQGVTLKEPHDASADATATLGLMQALAEKSKKGNGGIVSQIYKQE